MWLRANIVLVVAVIFALVQMFASATGGPRPGSSDTVFDAVTRSISRSVQSVSAQDDNEDNSGGDNSDNSDSSDNSDNSDDGDNSGSDNSDNSDSSDNSDNSGSDNSDNSGGGDNDQANLDADVVIDNVAPSASAAGPTPTATTRTAPAPAASQPAANAAPPAASPSPSPQAVREVTVVTTGVDQTLSLNDRISMQLFSAMPVGTTVTLRIVDPLNYPATPGIRAGDLIFQIEAQDASGAALTALPAEANLTVRYTDQDVLGLTEANITMARLDPATNQWTTAPKLVTDPASNVISASITDLGVYAVYVP